MNNSAQGPRLIPRKLKPFLNATNHIALRIKIYCKPIRRCYTFGNQPIMVIDFSQSVAAKLSFWPWKLPQNLDRRANKKKRATTLTLSHHTHTRHTTPLLTLTQRTLDTNTRCFNLNPLKYHHAFLYPRCLCLCRSGGCPPDRVCSGFGNYLRQEHLPGSRTMLHRHQHLHTARGLVCVSGRIPCVLMCSRGNSEYFT